MKFLRKLLARGRVRAARKVLAQDPSPRSYAALAQEYIRAGLLTEGLGVCEEGLQAFAGNTLLSRLADRTRRAEREERMTKVRRLLHEAPRPALWCEMCEILIELGRVGRAEDTALQWIESCDEASEGEALLMLARVRVERFFADRGRELGVVALASLDDACHALTDDVRPQRLKLILLMRIGAWADARTVAKRLLELDPGAPEMEGRFRTLEDRAENSPTIDHALLKVERTGRFADDEDGSREKVKGSGNVRPMLRRLAEDADVHAALYVRGSTVLIQGPKGATAERMARSVRNILSSGRSTSRRLGLGQIFQMQIEGDFGKLSVAPGEVDAGAVWSRGALGRAREEALLGLAGINAEVGGDAVEVGE